jgi:thioredoxin-related protein
MFLTPDFQIITPLQGYVKKEDFEPIVNYLGQDFFMPEKNMVWEDYKAKYKPGQGL